MKIHEYQARQILKSFGVPVPAGDVAISAPQAQKIAQEIGGNVWAVKAQVHAGGRGKAGGVRIAHSLEEVYEIASALIGSRLVTHQTGPQGAPVEKVLIQQGVAIDKEFYVSFLIDREQQCPILLASTEGGVDIEKVAAETPDKIIRMNLDSETGLTEKQAEEAADKLGFTDKDQKAKAAKVLLGLSKTFLSMDCSLVEINPLILTKAGDVFPLDCKMTFDDNALFRHTELGDLVDPSQEEPTELEAHQAGLQYIQLKGNIACLVNGAGLAMATMDTIKLFGGEPDNFLDIGGGASVENVTAAFKIMLSKPEVKVILVNIFGGIMKCDVIASGVVEACRNVDLNIPLVIRMKGTNEDIGKEILRNSGLKIIPAETLGEAAKTAVRLARGE
ncbi:MAG: ADP-forming succinate--CoA ligase subunit beta [Burkholderiales bacterium]|nr:ADP-forming succinate--CoA ligase subunit beta [Burkholderiales bacterium]